MLCCLTIDNFKLIDQLECEFGPGLNVLTGETGAGKSILLKALALLFGQPADRELFRDPTRPLLISAVFTPPTEPAFNHLISASGLLDGPETEELIFRRRLALNRRGTVSSRAYLNDQPVTNSTLATLTEYLFEFVDQHRQQRLRDPNEARRLLDAYGGLDPLQKKYLQHFSRFRELDKGLDKWRRDLEAAARQLDYYAYQLQELQSVDLDPEQEDELRESLARFRQLGRLQELTAQVAALSYTGENSVLDNCYRLAELLEELRQRDPGLPVEAGLLTPVIDTLQELYDKINNYSEHLELDEGEISEAENRLAALERLKRKFTTDTAGLLQLRKDIAAKLSRWDNREIEERQREEELHKQQLIVRQAAAALSQERRHQAQKMGAEITQRLQELNLPAARFAVEILSSDNIAEWKNDGADRVRFLFSANPGEEPAPLDRVASGGELSRLLLALQSAVAGRYRIPTLIFDEIDTGLGGGTAAAVGRAIAKIATSHQVITVTHLPQVAAFAEHHLLIRKETNPETAVTRIELSRLPTEHQDARITELARMSSGAQITTTAIEHARSLLAEVHTWRSGQEEEA